MKRTPDQCNSMAEIREEIDALDRELMAMLRRRADYIDRAASIKVGIDMPARVEARVEEVVQNARNNAVKEGLNPDLAEKLWRKMIEWSIAREEMILGKENDSKNH